MKMKRYKVARNAQFADMSPERFGEKYPAPHRGEVGTQIDYFDEMPVLKFADGAQEQYPFNSLAEQVTCACCEQELDISDAVKTEDAKYPARKLYFHRYECGPSDHNGPAWVR